MPKRFRNAPAQLHLKQASASIVAQIEEDPNQIWNGFIRPILSRAQVHADRVEIEIDANRLALQLRHPNAVEGFGSARVSPNPQSGPNACASVAELKFVFAGDVEPSPADAALVRVLVRARQIQRRIETSRNATLDEIGAAEKATSGYATRLMRLNFIAPDIVEAILAGRQPPGLTANKLMAVTRLPLDWRDQRVQLGFVKPDRAAVGA